MAKLGKIPEPILMLATGIVARLMKVLPRAMLKSEGKLNHRKIRNVIDMSESAEELLNQERQVQVVFFEIQMISPLVYLLNKSG